MTSRYIGKVRLARQVSNELTFRRGANHRPARGAKLIPVGGEPIATPHLGDVD